MSKTSTVLIIILAIVICVFGGALIVKVRDGVAGRSAVKETNSVMQNQATKVFNSAFTSYEGKQRGSTVKSLIQSVINSNATNYPDNQIVIEYSGKEYKDQEIRRVLDDVGVAKTYTISLKYDQNELVNKIIIAE